MKGINNNEISVRTLENLKESIDNRIHEIYNQGYREGYKDGVNDTVIDIVHCKDCKHSKVYTIDSNDEPQRWCTAGIVKAVNDDDYCSWGVRGDILNLVYPIGAIALGQQGKTATELYGGVWKEIATNVFERIE